MRQSRSSTQVRVGLLLLFVLGPTLLTVQLWAVDGWPMNHETTDFATRTRIVATHFEHGDLLPIWSSADNDGFGSPQPALYHKLFYIGAASLLVAGLSLKAALVVALIGTMAAGAVGMHCLVRELGAARWVAATGGLILVASNYTTTNWLVRGAVAELSAAMLVPWVLWSLVKTLRLARIQPWLPVSLALLFWAHSVLCLYVAGLIGVVVLVALATGRASRGLLSPGPLALAAVGFLILAAPAIVATTVMGRGYDIGRIVPSAYHPTNQFRPVGSYLVDRGWSWGETYRGLTVQLDLPILLALGIAAVGTVRSIRPAPQSTRSSASDGGAVWCLCGVALLAFLFQLRIAAPIYDLVPGAKFIQFPWRLLGLLVPALIALLLVLLDRWLTPPRVRYAAAACLIATALLGGALRPIRYDRISLDRGWDGVTFSFFGEYVPTSAGEASPPPRRRVAAAQGELGCTVTRGASQQETLVVTFEAQCTRSARVPLAIFSSPLHAVEVDAADHQRCLDDLADWDGLCGVELDPGLHTIEVHLPTGADLVRSLGPGPG